MAKEKVFIVISHKHTLKRGLKKRSGTADDWEVAETVEFVNQLRDRHITMSSAVGDYLNRKIVSGSSKGMGDYDKFEEYVRSKYGKQMTELDSAYGAMRTVLPPPAEEIAVTMVDQFGNKRAATIFDAPFTENSEILPVK